MSQRPVISGEQDIPWALTQSNLSQHMYHPEYWITTIMLPSLHILFLRCNRVQRKLFRPFNLLIVCFENHQSAFLQRLYIDKFPTPSSMLFSCLFISNAFQCNCIQRLVIIVDCCHFRRLFLACVLQSTTYLCNSHLMTCIPKHTLKI